VDGVDGTLLLFLYSELQVEHAFESPSVRLAFTASQDWTHRSCYHLP
jgi:hypothetical protein